MCVKHKFSAYYSKNNISYNIHSPVLHFHFNIYIMLETLSYLEPTGRG